MPSLLRGRTRANPGTPRSCLHHSADEFRIETADLAPQDLARVEQVVADRRLAAPEDVGDLARLELLHLLEHERGLLLLGEPAGDALEEPRELGVLGDPRRVGGRALLALPDQVERRAMSPLARPRAAEEVDRQVRRDAVEPGVQREALVVAMDLVPHAE